MREKKSFLAGVIVSIVAFNYLYNYDLVSKIVFSVALMVILSMNLNLYTSKVATICCSDLSIKSKIENLVSVFVFNAIACVIFGLLFSFIGETHGPEIWAAKMQSNLFIAFYKAIIVGILMQIAATCKKDIVTVGVVLLFIGTGGEHSIANIVYMSVARAITIKGFLYVIYTAIGNAVGGILVYVLNKDSDNKKIKSS